MDAKKLYAEWKQLKLENISLQRCGIDGNMAGHLERDSFVNSRIIEIELQLYNLLPDKEEVVAENITEKEFERLQDRFYYSGYLVDFIKLKDETEVKNGLVSGRVIYAKKP